MDPDQFNIQTLTGPKLSLTMLVGSAQPRISAGYGGWTVTARPRAAGITFWGGREPFQQVVVGVIDKFLDGDDVEDLCFRLERMALPPKDHQDPPIVDLDGIQIQKTTLKWVIENLEWLDDGLERNDSGKRTRQTVQITLRQYVTDSRLKASKRKKTSHVRGGNATPVH